MAKVFHVHVSFWARWNALCFFRAASNCWSIPGFGVWKKMRHRLLAFCALIACVLDPAAAPPAWAIHEPTQREATTKLMIGIRIAHSWGRYSRSAPLYSRCATLSKNGL